MAIIHIPFRHTLTVDVNDIINHCDSTQLNELIILAEKKLRQLENIQDAEEINTIYQIELK